MKSKVLGLVALLVLGGLFLQGLVRIHPFGGPEATSADDAYLAGAQIERAANNVVTAIVFDYRGFDTLGEGAVLFAAISAVTALFRGGGEHR
jgi:multisubunit Na+/H+ antiporter MnhB subunit